MKTNLLCSNLTNKYNPQEPSFRSIPLSIRSNLTNKYNPQEPSDANHVNSWSSNLTNKYNPQELLALLYVEIALK